MIRRSLAGLDNSEKALMQGRRDEVELLRERVRFLEGSDRALMTLYLENGGSVTQLARLLGQCESTIFRRVRKLARRLADERYLLCLRHRERFTGFELSVAREHFVAGRPMAQIGRRRGLSYYRVRLTVEGIKEKLDLIQAQSGGREGRARGR